MDNKCQIVDGKYEYDRIQLKNSESKYIYVPMSIITNNNIDLKRVGIFTYIKIHCGLNNTIGFTIPDMVEWCGMKPNKRPNKSNDKFLEIVDEFSKGGYLTYLHKQNKSSYMKCQFDMDYYYNECSDGYAVVYLDEIEKIMKYQKTNSKDNTITNTIILLVFAYLRHKIVRRPNELKPEERTNDGIQKRKQRLPEAFNSTIDDISKEIGISSKTISKTIDILEQELKLIVTDRMYRIQDSNGKFKTLPTIFTNAYKREGRYLLTSGTEYSRSEIENKVKKLNKYSNNYKIDKRKRKLEGD